MIMTNQQAIDHLEQFLAANPAGRMSLERTYVLRRLAEVTCTIAKQERAFRKQNGMDERGRWQR